MATVLEGEERAGRASRRGASGKGAFRGLGALVLSLSLKLLGAQLTPAARGTVGVGALEKAGFLCSSPRYVQAGKVGQGGTNRRPGCRREAEGSRPRSARGWREENRKNGEKEKRKLSER